MRPHRQDMNIFMRFFFLSSVCWTTYRNMKHNCNITVCWIHIRYTLFGRSVVKKESGKRKVVDYIYKHKLGTYVSQKMTDL